MAVFSVFRRENTRHSYCHTLLKLEEEARTLQCLLDASTSVS